MIKTKSQSKGTAQAVPFRISKKRLSAAFSKTTGFGSRLCFRAANPKKYENLMVFIRSDVHTVRAGIKFKEAAAS